MLTHTIAHTHSDRGEEAVQVRDDIAGVMAINEAFPAVMDEPAVHIRALLPFPPVVLLRAPV